MKTDFLTRVRCHFAYSQQLPYVYILTEIDTITLMVIMSGNATVSTFI